MTCRRVEGGLRIEPFMELSRMLKLRWSSRLLIEPDIVWVKLAK